MVEEGNDHLQHSHSASEAMENTDQSEPFLQHSSSDGVVQTKHAKQRELVRIDEGLYSSTASLTWAGQQAVNIHSHAADEETEDGAGIMAPTGRVTVPLAVSALIAAFGSSVPHGWNTGVLNTPSHLIKGFLNETYTDRFGSIPSEQLLNFLWSLSVSIYLVGGCGGAFSAGWFANTVGRKKALLICHVFGFVSAVLFAFCDLAKSFEMFILARLIVGFGCGAGSGLVPMYLTEIAPVNVRGAMGVLHQFGLTTGILLSQIFGLSQILGHEDRWPYLLALTAFPCLVSAIVLPFYPESPRFLYVNKQDEKAAEKALQTFRQEEDVSLDIMEMKYERDQQQKEPEWTFMQVFRTKNVQMQLTLVCILAVAQQLSGINVVFYYSTGVFTDAGIPDEYTQYATLGAGFINVLMTGISVPLMDRAGRRKLLLGGMIGMIVSAAIMTVALALKDTVPWMSYFSIICTIGFVIGFAIGLGSIPQFIGAELFKQGPRPPAMSFAGLLNWLCNVIVGISFPLMAPYTGAYSFLPFIATLLIFGAFLWWKLPETKGKTYEEIWRHFVKEDPSVETPPEKKGLLDPVHIKNDPKKNTMEVNGSNGEIASNGGNSHAANKV